MDEIIEIDACLTDDGSKDEILELSETDDELIPTSSKTSQSTSEKVRISSHDSGIDVSNEPASVSNILYPTEPNMTHVRLELGTRDGSGIYLGEFISILASATCLQKTGSETGFLAQNLDRLQRFSGQNLKQESKTGS